MPAPDLTILESLYCPLPDNADHTFHTLMQRLRQDTRVEHEMVEQQVAIEARLASRDRYSDLLQHLYGLYAPLESLLATHRGSSVPQLNMASRWKTPWLLADLNTFGIDPQTIPVYTGDFPLHNRASFLGILYVIEGSSLGGQLIYRALQDRLGLTSETGARFFAGYQDHISAQWRSFGEAVNMLVCPFDAPDTIQAAKRMFNIFGTWVGRS